MNWQKMAMSLACGAVVAGVGLAPCVAEACGGTFCDVGPGTMPVDQAGENVLFTIADGKVQAHIQISVTSDTPASQFAWVIPMLEQPTFSLGSDQFFSQLLTGSVPSYGMLQDNEVCEAGGRLSGNPSADLAGGDDGGGVAQEEDGGGGVDVLVRETLGAYDIAVLSSGSIEEMMKWLGDNGYQQDPAAVPILEQYIAEGHLFVALKLKMGAEIDEVQPIVLTYDGDESCVPIRLTRIAAEEDMDLRIFFLGQHRAVPINYRHVLVNPLRIDWLNNAANYKEVITAAVDSEMADGNAFVTEYAGASSVAGPNLFQPQWDATIFAGMQAAPERVVDELSRQQLMSCFGSAGGTNCQYMHNLLLPLLQSYLPAPAGVGEDEFYNCLDCNSNLIDREAWKAEDFAADLHKRIFEPAQRADDLLARNPYLSRLYTTISPAEMMVDPIFQQNPDLPEVDNIRVATQKLWCDETVTVELPDGRLVVIRDGVWPEFPEEMPWVEEVAQMSIAGPSLTLLDRRADIEPLLDAWNGDDLPRAQGCVCTASSTGPAGALWLMSAFALGLGWRRRRLRTSN